MTQGIRIGGPATCQEVREPLMAVTCRAPVRASSLLLGEPLLERLMEHGEARRLAFPESSQEAQQLEQLVM